MTIDIFLDHVRQVGPWHLSGRFGEAIRHVEDDLCLLQKVCLHLTGERLAGTAFAECGRRLGLSTADIGSIFRASDVNQDPSLFPQDHALRNRLLEACVI